MGKIQDECRGNPQRVKVKAGIEMSSHPLPKMRFVQPENEALRA
jgi:hypothetical protein